MIALGLQLSVHDYPILSQLAAASEVPRKVAWVFASIPLFTHTLAVLLLLLITNATVFEFLLCHLFHYSWMYQCPISGHKNKDQTTHSLTHI